jgi:hypothetical protein
MARKCVIILAAITGMTVFHCSLGPISGNGSHTGNPVAVGRILTADGRPAAGALVRIVPVDYVPSFALAKSTPMPMCTSDAEGRYSIFAIDSGAYNLEAVLDSLGVFEDSVKIVAGLFNQSIEDAYLHRLGCISGISFMPGQNDTNQVRVSIYMPGTRRITKPVIGGEFSFDLVPAGKYQLIFDPTLNAYNVKVLDITLAAGECKNLDTVLLNKYEPDTIQINQASVAGTWGPGKVYFVLATPMVPAGQTLTVLPGTTIELFGSFQNYGELHIQGTKDSLVKIENVYANARSMYEILSYSGAAPNDTPLRLRWVVIKNMLTGLDLMDSCASISNCAFINCDRALFLGGMAVKISNCIFWRNNCSIENDATGHVSIVNSVFIGNDSCVAAFWSRSDTTSPTFDHCLFYNNKGLPADSLMANSKFSDPFFVSLDTINPDFHLQAGSPCAKAGVDSTDIGLYSTYQPK